LPGHSQVEGMGICLFTVADNNLIPMDRERGGGCH
jgi:hypothetical protein